MEYIIWTVVLNPEDEGDKFLQTFLNYPQTS
jgi:hypothetical protein